MKQFIIATVIATVEFFWLSSIQQSLGVTLARGGAVSRGLSPFGIVVLGWLFVCVPAIRNMYSFVDGEKLSFGGSREMNSPAVAFLLLGWAFLLFFAPITIGILSSFVK